jgi:molecular chaperone DnaK
MVYEVEKNSKEWADRLDAANKERLTKAVEGAKEALRTGAPDAVKTGLDELSQAYSAAGASLYEAARAQSAESGAAGEAKTEPPKKQEDVVEADYEVVDDNKS